MDISKLTEWLKLSPRYLLPISLVTGFLLFATTNLLNTFGLSSLVGQYRPYVGVIFLVSTALLVTDWIIKLYKWIQTKRHQSALYQGRQKRLHNLTGPEKEILKGYLDNQTKSQYLSLESGVVNGLEAENIIYRASQIGRVDWWAYNIQPWAWDYLNNHPELLLVEEKPKNVTTRNHRRISRY